MIRLLLIDDNPQDRLLALRELEREFVDLETEQIIQADDFERALSAGQFDLVITDYQLRWSDGLTVLRTLKALYPDRPVIMFTNSGSEEIAVEAMKSGLDDYVIKSPKQYVRLPTAVRLALKHREAQQQVAGLEDRLQTLLNRLNVGVYRLNSDGVLLEGNPAFLRLLGANAFPNNPAKVTLESYFPAAEYAELLQQLRQHGEVRDRELQLQRLDGQQIWVRISKTLTQLNQLTIIDGLIEDISERKRIELENARLYQAAQDANRLKDEFLAIVSHELRTPLNSMLGWAQTLKTRSLSPAMVAKAIDVIERNAKLQNQLIGDILDVSRIVQNQFRLNVHRVNLLPLIQASIDDLHPAAAVKSIQLEFSSDASISPILGDGERLQQVVWNLLANAIKFTPPGGRVTVQLREIRGQDQTTADRALRESPTRRSVDRANPSTSVQPDSVQTDLVQIIVCDNGQGISPDFLPHVFDRFRQADSSKTRAYGGLGLGLAIVRHLVEIHGGTVQASSQGMGKGATFTVCLPISGSPFMREAAAQE